MKKQILSISASLIVALFAVGIAAAQGDKKMTKGEMDIEAMHKSPLHNLTMAHHHSAMAFATVLRDTTKDGKIADVDVARKAFAEIKHCMDQMEMINRMRMSGMSKEMMEKMKPMMAEMKPKMDAEKAEIFEHIAALERAFQNSSPNGGEIHTHAAALVSVLEKMMPSAKKMAMADKKPM